MYDGQEGVLGSTLTAPKPELQCGYDPVTPRPATSDGQVLEIPTNPPKRPFYRTRRGIIIMTFLIIVVIVAAVVGALGGVVWGSKKKTNNAPAIGSSNGSGLVPTTGTNNNTSPLIVTGASQSNGTALTSNSLPNFTAYANFNATGHQLKFNQLSAQGYRMISLSAYGQPPNHLYAAAWVQRSGPAYVAVHEANGAQYQSFFDGNHGFVSTFITVTGPPGGEIFAGIMEQNGINNWFQLCNLTTAQYEAELSSAVAKGYILKSFTEYGSTSQRLYCGVWYQNDQHQPFNTFVDESYTDYQTTFNSQVANPGWRPGYLSVSEDHLISSEFVNTNVGSWVARHGMSPSDLESELNTQLAAGLYPIHLQGGGTGDNINFAALWAQQDIPV